MYSSYANATKEMHLLAVKSYFKVFDFIKMEMDAISIGAIAWIGFNYLILCPFMMYSCYTFCSKSKEHESLKKYRNKPLVLCLNLMMLFTLLVERPYANAVAIWQIIDINWIFYLVFSISWWSAFFYFS